jgi:serine/threonine protein kinase
VTLTAAGFVLGTPDFLPPEVAAGARATRQSDSWQLAATIGYALTGHPPRGDTPDALSGLRAAAVGGPPTHLPPRSAHLRLLQAALGDDAGRRPSLPAVQAAPRHGCGRPRPAGPSPRRPRRGDHATAAERSDRGVACHRRTDRPLQCVRGQVQRTGPPPR